MSKGLRFETEADFNTWHNAEMIKRNIPHGQTTKYAQLMTLSDNTLGCLITDDYVGDNVIEDFETLLPVIDIGGI